MRSSLAPDTFLLTEAFFFPPSTRLLADSATNIDQKTDRGRQTDKSIESPTRTEISIWDADRKTMQQLHKSIGMPSQK